MKTIKPLALTHPSSIKRSELLKDFYTYQKRAYLILNLLVPGLGFVLFNRHIFEGFLTFCFYITSLLLFFFYFLFPNPQTNQLVLLIPTLIISIISFLRLNKFIVHTY
ncbi:MAG: hypothetical protein ACRCST_06970 [Turicibacter sp.]